ncbi:hypothetical protein KJA15_00395 [Patescibacteria group bacterium]|nr:hypothetical protein [Patescibacteria group bacterium]
MSERYRCKGCGAEFECEGIVVEGKTGHTASQYGFKKIKEGNDPSCRFCGGNFIWIPALKRIKETKEPPRRLQDLLNQIQRAFQKTDRPNFFI